MLMATCAGPRDTQLNRAIARIEKARTLPWDIVSPPLVERQRDSGEAVSPVHLAMLDNGASGQN
jgi:hypothetical protein